MTDRSARGNLSTDDLAILLEVTRSLAAPFDLMSMLAAVTAAARQVLRAERSSVWLHDAAAGELVLEVSSDIRHVRIPVGHGLVGACARDRQLLNVADCYADPRFDQQVDRRSGYRTRCSLTLPLIDHAGALVGVMQVLNRIDGTFQAADEQLASALAAQCAVALQRVQMIESLIEGEKMRREMEMAQVVQMSTLPQAMPVVAGYDVHGTFRPALLTGGDTFDLAPVGDGLLVVLGDATGHGIAPALSVTQMHAMLRIAFRLGAALETAFAQVNDLLAETLAEDRFVTAFIGVLDPRAHVLRYVSAGQGPILHFHADRGTCSRHKPTSFPLGAMALPRPPRAAEMIFAPGDVLVLLSDGIYEYGNGAGEQFGEDRVEQVVAGHHAHGMAALSAALLDAVQAFAGGAAQEDDITVVLVRRGPAVSESAAFARRIDVLAEIVAFTTAAFARQGIPAALRADVDFVLEELFTNIVKYGRGKAPVAIEIAAIPGGVEVTLTEPEADRFDVTQASPVDVTLPAVQRQPGGLGLHLIPRLVDSVQYGYSEGERCSRIVFRKTDAAPSPGVAGHNEDQRC